jgi:hypothetical protein
MAAVTSLQSANALLKRKFSQEQIEPDLKLCGVQ